MMEERPAPYPGQKHIPPAEASSCRAGRAERCRQRERWEQYRGKIPPAFKTRAPLREQKLNATPRGSSLLPPPSQGSAGEPNATRCSQPRARSRVTPAERSLSVPLPKEAVRPQKSPDWLEKLHLHLRVMQLCTSQHRRLPRRQSAGLPRGGSERGTRSRLWSSTHHQKRQPQALVRAVWRSGALFPLKRTNRTSRGEVRDRSPGTARSRTRRRGERRQQHRPPPQRQRRGGHAAPSPSSAAALLRQTQRRLLPWGGQSPPPPSYGIR